MTPARKKQLKSKAHTLKPVVIIGQSGLTESVLNEIDIALNVHELIKIKIRAEKPQRVQFSEEIIAKLDASHIQHIGQIIVLYRKNPQKQRA